MTVSIAIFFGIAPGYRFSQAHPMTGIISPGELIADGLGASKHVGSHGFNAIFMAAANRLFPARTIPLGVITIAGIGSPAAISDAYFCTFSSLIGASNRALFCRDSSTLSDVIGVCSRYSSFPWSDRLFLPLGPESKLPSFFSYVLPCRAAVLAATAGI